MSDRPIDVYLYGMVVQSTIHKLAAAFPELDTYGEIAESFFLPGGEAGNSATVLAGLGHRVRLDGPHLGTRTRDAVLSFYAGVGVDCSGMEYDPAFAGVEDLVLVAEKSRTVFGKYARYFSEGVRRWSIPSREAIRDSRIVGLDPFFKEESDMVARTCVEYGRPYVTIDCPADSFMARNAACVVISNEHIRNHHAGTPLDELFRTYAEACAGLVVFTFGGRDIMYGCRGAEAAHFAPYKVEVRSTLGAGDTFRAGIMEGMLQGLSDRDCVAFAAAMAACVCREFPVGLHPPTLETIRELQAAQPR